jgi:peptidylprolyl isomerase
MHSKLLGAITLFLALVLPCELSAQVHTSSGDEWVDMDPEYTLYVFVPSGRIVIALTQDLALNHVRRIKLLVREQYYDGLPFLRVIPGFISQAGDPSEFPDVLYEAKSFSSVSDRVEAEFDAPLSAGEDFVPIRLADEFNEQQGYLNGFPAARSLSDSRIWLTGCAGAVGMPRGVDRDSGTTGFWIAQQPQRYNDRHHTIFGRVVSGLRHALLMQPASVDEPSSWTVIDSVRVAIDLPAEKRTSYEILNTSSSSFKDYLDSLQNPAAEWYRGKPRRIDTCIGWVVSLREQGDDQ